MKIPPLCLIFTFLRLECARPGSIYASMSSNSYTDKTDLTGFHKSCPKNDDGLLVSSVLGASV